MAGIIILLVFICLVTGLLIMPIHVRINIGGEGFYTYKPGFFRLNIDLDGENLISVILFVFFVGFSWYPLQKKTGQPSKIKAPEKKKRRFDLLKWNRLKFLISVAWQSIKKSKVKKLYLDMDTSNAIINANLYPVFELLNERPGINLNINYTGNFTLSLDVQNNLWNVLQVLIWNLLKRSTIFTKNK
jgi:hypothetical protein